MKSTFVRFLAVSTLLGLAVAAVFGTLGTWEIRRASYLQTAEWHRGRIESIAAKLSASASSSQATQALALRFGSKSNGDASEKRKERLGRRDRLFEGWQEEDARERAHLIKLRRYHAQLIDTYQKAARSPWQTPPPDPPKPK